jgi:hypothetical protein
MPYVDSLIPWESHKEDCPNPLARRLYIRDYDKNGKQRFVPWGLTCTKCGIIVKQKYEHNLSPKEKKREDMQKRLDQNEEYSKAMETAFGPKLSKEEKEHNLDWYHKNVKIARRKAKESKIRKKVSEVVNRQLERAYKIRLAIREGNS